MPPTEQELLSAISENIIEVIDSAEDDDHAQELLAQYEHLLTEPEQMQALVRELEGETEGGDGAEQLSLERVRRKVRKLAERRYPRK